MEEAIPEQRREAPSQGETGFDIWVKGGRVIQVADEQRRLRRVPT